MWLSDLKKAIEKMEEHFLWQNCFSRIEVSLFGMSYIFYPLDASDYYYIYYKQNRRIVKRYSDTWKNPEHEEIIYEGDE